MMKKKEKKIDTIVLERPGSGFTSMPVFTINGMRPDEAGNISFSWEEYIDPILVSRKKFEEYYDGQVEDKDNNTGN